jgi:hypothetical protein
MLVSLSFFLELPLVREPPNPRQPCPFLSTHFIIYDNLTHVQIEERQNETSLDPIECFMYALKSSEAWRQYPRRLKLFFDFIGIRGDLDKQGQQFLEDFRKDVGRKQKNLMRFLGYHKERVRRKELAAGTLKNYYRSAKLFCYMNDIVFNCSIGSFVNRTSG